MPAALREACVGHIDRREVPRGRQPSPEQRTSVSAERQRVGIRLIDASPRSLQPGSTVARLGFGVQIPGRSADRQPPGRKSAAPPPARGPCQRWIWIGGRISSVGQVANLPLDSGFSAEQAGWQPAPRRRCGSCFSADPMTFPAASGGRIAVPTRLRYAPGNFYYGSDADREVLEAASKIAWTDLDRCETIKCRIPMYPAHSVCRFCPAAHGVYRIQFR